MEEMQNLSFQKYLNNIYSDITKLFQRPGEKPTLVLPDWLK